MSEAFADGTARQLSQTDKTVQQLRAVEAHQVGRNQLVRPDPWVGTEGWTQLDQGSRALEATVHHEKAEGRELDGKGSTLVA